ncbi:unnamed protein product [Amoebophrya sp. A120]|nr:unnamed protein product [Amoebophrya sp. A120]|eukprot:GSA120T00005396001.1
MSFTKSRCWRFLHASGAHREEVRSLSVRVKSAQQEVQQQKSARDSLESRVEEQRESLEVLQQDLQLLLQCERDSKDREREAWQMRQEDADVLDMEVWLPAELRDQKMRTTSTAEERTAFSSTYARILRCVPIALLPTLATEFFERLELEEAALLRMQQGNNNRTGEAGRDNVYGDGGLHEFDEIDRLDGADSVIDELSQSWSGTVDHRTHRMNHDSKHKAVTASGSTQIDVASQTPQRFVDALVAQSLQQKTYRGRQALMMAHGVVASDSTSPSGGQADHYGTAGTSSPSYLRCDPGVEQVMAGVVLAGSSNGPPSPSPGVSSPSTNRHAKTKFAAAVRKAQCGIFFAKRTTTGAGTAGAAGMNQMLSSNLESRDGNAMVSKVVSLSSTRGAAGVLAGGSAVGSGTGTASALQKTQSVAASFSNNVNKRGSLSPGGKIFSMSDQEQVAQVVTSPIVVAAGGGNSAAGGVPEQPMMVVKSPSNPSPGSPPGKQKEKMKMAQILHKHRVVSRFLNSIGPEQ